MAYKIMGVTSSPFYTNMMIYYIMCDTPADLPSTISDIGYGTVIGYGSRADIISDSSKYLWNGSQWVRQTTGGGGGASSADQVSYDNTDSGLTATNVQDAIDEIHDTDETQDRTLAELQGEDANQQLEIDYAINTGSKNLFPNIATSQTIGGVTFTVNGDGTVTANGTKTNNDWFILSENNSFDAGTYTLSDGLPDDTIGCRLIIGPSRSLGSAIMSTATGLRTQTKTFSDAQTGLYYGIRIESGKTVNNLTFKPMIRRAEITDNTYKPYAPTNRELYEAKTEQTETNAIANLGAKNLLEYNGYGTGAENGVTYTINADGTITVNGTPQGTSPSYIELKLNGNAVNVSRFCDGHHILSGCPVGGSDSTYRMYAARGTYSRFDYGNGVLLTSTTLTDVRLVVYISNGYTANNLVFKPMIRPAEITDSTYVPYAPTNRELYETCETKVTMQQAYGDATGIPANSDLNNYTTPGIYYALVANVSSMANTPYTSTGLRLVVEKNTLSGAAVFQALYPTSRSHLEFYRRVYEGGSWSSWYKFEGTQVASVQSLNSPLTLNREELTPLETDEIRETEEIEETNEIEETE